MNRPRGPGIATNVLRQKIPDCDVVVTGLRQSIQTPQEIKQNNAYSELPIRTASIQFGRPFRRNAADVGATGDWRQ